MSGSDNILDQIDRTLGDWSVSPDAMRSTPDSPPPLGLAPPSGSALVPPAGVSAVSGSSPHAASRGSATPLTAAPRSITRRVTSVWEPFSGMGDPPVT